MNVYSCKTYLPFIPIILVTLIPVVIGIYFVANFKNPFAKDPTKVVLSGIALIVLGVFFLSVYIYSYIDNYQNVFLPAQSGKGVTIEGRIADFNPSDFLDNRADRFSVNGIEFAVSPNSLAPGYHKTASKGGVLNSEGLFVRITYVKHNNEVYIVSITSP